MNTQRLVDRFIKYVKCSSESGNERNFCLMMEQELTSLGLEVKRDEVGDKAGSNGWNILARLDGEGEPLILSCHLDTVIPGKNISPVIRDGVVYSDGSTILGADDKSGIAAAMEALQSIIEDGTPHRPVEIMFSVCEETGLKGAKYADYSFFRGKEALVLDTSDVGSIINRSPAFVRMYFTISGKAAHAAVSPESGIHALKAAAEAVSAIPCGRQDDGATVMNVGQLIAKGETNIIPPLASFDMEIRSFSEELLEWRIAQTKRTVVSICKKYGASCTYRIDRQAGVLRVDESTPLIQKLKEVYKKLGIEPTVSHVYSGCDATWLFDAGMDVVNLGTGMTDFHSVKESVAVKDMELTAKMVYEMIK